MSNATTETDPDDYPLDTPAPDKDGDESNSTTVVPPQD